MSAIQVNPQTQAPDSERPNVQKLGWALDELARSLSVSVPFIRLEVKRGRLKAAHLGRRVVVLDTEVRRYLAQASATDRSWR
jgi:excisionase family DNA binding protein